MKQKMEIKQEKATMTYLLKCEREVWYQFKASCALKGRSIAATLKKLIQEEVKS